jgi:glycosyltransferase involved in cell wall biosynthesis
MMFKRQSRHVTAASLDGLPTFSTSTPLMKILSIIEATTVNGPAKNLLNFCRLVQTPDFAVDGKPLVEISIVTFHRDVSEPRAVATGSSRRLSDPNATAPGSDTPSSTPNSFVAAAREMGVTVDVIHERFRFDRSAINQLREIVAQRKPDVIETHMIKSHFLVKLAGLHKQHHWSAYHHGYTSTDAKMLVYNQLNRWSLPSADRVIAVCDAFAKQLVRAGVRRERISVCHNSVKPPRNIPGDEQQSLRSKFRIADDEQVIVSVGRLSREKGHNDLVHAIALMREIEPALKFKVLFVGDGPEREQLETVARDLRIQDDIVFVGHVSDVAPFYSIADVSALPSHSEGSPNALLEAMAAGLPIVATAVGGVPEIAMSGENALLTTPHQPREFADALVMVLTDKSFAAKIAGNAVMRARDFSPEAQALQLTCIYQALVSEPGADMRRGKIQPPFYDQVAVAPSAESL